MSQKSLIKIIKRDERQSPSPPVSEHSTEDKAEDSTRQVTSTVAGWVREFQKRGRAGLLSKGEMDDHRHVGNLRPAKWRGPKARRQKRAAPSLHSQFNDAVCAKS
jgi:hypothetical protein